MNEQLLFDVGCQKHIEQVSRAEANFSRSAAIPVRDRATMRSRLAIALVKLASQLQPDLQCEVPKPVRPVTAG